MVSLIVQQYSMATQSFPTQPYVVPSMVSTPDANTRTKHFSFWFYYGAEGKDFEYTDDNKVHRLTTDWGMAGYTQGTFFNVTQTDDVDFNQWDEVEELNEKATPSEMLGFNLDTSNIETELANCRAVYEKYYSELFTGAQDPRELVKTIDAELETAGWETIREEAQKQIDAQK